MMVLGSPRCFILGGTYEARPVAEFLHGAGGVVLSSLAGVTRNPRLPVGSVRLGGYGGRAAMARFLERWGAELLIDCAHPFAVRIKSRLARVAGDLGVALWAYEREAWRSTEHDLWYFADSMDEALGLASGLGRRIFVALGGRALSAARNEEAASEGALGSGTAETLSGARNEAAAGAAAFEGTAEALLGALARLECELLLFRQVPGGVGSVGGDGGLFLSRVAVESGYPAEDAASEEALLRHYGIDVVLCKESGGSRSFGKLVAARRLGLPVVILRKPNIEYPHGTQFFNDVKALKNAINVN